MRLFILVSCLCLASSVYASVGNVEDGSKMKNTVIETKLIRPEVKLFKSSRQTRQSSEKVKIKMDIEALSVEDRMFVKYLLNAEELKELVENSKKQRFDSISCVMNSTGEKVSRQLYFYYENGLPKRNVNYLWNTQINDWDEFQVFNYVWDEDGYCLEQSGYSDLNNYGTKLEFIYNDRKFGIQQISYDYSNGKWIPSAKGEYKYDEYGNIIEEMIYSYQDGSWVKVIWNKASWTPEGWQTGFESYYWDGTNWQPNAEKQEISYDNSGHVTSNTLFIWDEQSENWLHYERFEQTFDENGRCIMQEDKFWNKALGTWDGCEEYHGEVLYNVKSLIEYDDQGRETYEVTMKKFNSQGEYINRVDIKKTYTSIENGETKQYEETFDYNEDGTSKTLTGKFTLHYNSDGNRTYAIEAMKIDEVWRNYYEEVYSYNEKGSLLGSTYWVFTSDSDNKKLADISEKYIYDEHNNVIDSYYKMGQGTSEDDWVNTTRFTYAYENDTVRIDKMRYLWDGTEYIPDWGEGFRFDYLIPVSDIQLWVGTPPFHKIIEERKYQGSGQNWDYQLFKYYYSDIVSGIDTVIENDKIKVYMTSDNSVLIIEGKDNDAYVNIYNIQGSLVLSSLGNNIDMSTMPCGMYIVKTDGKTFKVIKK